MTEFAARSFIDIVVMIQLVGAVLTFTPMRDRRRGWGSLYVVGFLIVLWGASRAPFFEPASIPGAAVLIAAVVLFVWARVTIQGKMFSYINSTDVPQFVCSSGPYRWIRHPFYSSYLLTLLASTAMFPSYITLGGLALAIFSFTNAAKFEEGKFDGSPLAAEYAAYTHRTGRFLPRFSHTARP